MSERAFRLILGSWLLVALSVKSDPALAALVGVLLFEGVTNWRIPRMVSRMRYGADAVLDDSAGPAIAIRGGCPLPFDAERALRLMIVAFLWLAFQVLPDVLWWFPWFIGFALVAAGLSGICPMVLALRWLGFR